MTLPPTPYVPAPVDAEANADPHGQLPLFGTR